MSRSRSWWRRDLGLRAYAPVYAAMKNWTGARTPETADEVWVVEHPPVFTQGLNGKPAHLLAPGDIPVVAVDRGGQVTYHGPGQIVVYPLLDIERASIGVRTLVDALEGAVVDLLASRGIEARPKPEAPGVYVGERKIASLGLRVRRGRCYHGLAVNVDMDLAPFERINPCGYAGLQMTQLAELCDDFAMQKATDELLHHLASRLGYADPLPLSDLPTASLPEDA